MTFSIITPAFNQLDWLRLCIASVADQVTGEDASRGKLKAVSCKDGNLGKRIITQVDSERPSPNADLLSAVQSPLAIEHIIQDGGTPGVIEFFQKLIPELGLELLPIGGDEVLRAGKPGYTLILHSGPDAGMYDAINKGITHMTGDLWAWINCDEQYLPRTLPYVAEWFDRHLKVDILCGDALLTDEEGAALSYRRIIPPNWRHTRLVHLSSLSCTSFYRRSIVESGGVFDTSWRSIGDAEWMARLISQGVKIGACRKLLSSFAFTGQNTSQTPLAREEAGKWCGMSDAPSPWFTLPTIWIHRVRKWLAGSYRLKSVHYALYQKNTVGRVVCSAGSVGWGWPSVEGANRNQKSENGRLVEERGCEPEEIFILGTPLLATTSDDLGERLVSHARHGTTPLAVDFANTHVVTMRRHDWEFARLTESIDLVVPDGMPLVWAMNWKGAGLKDRIYGPTFTRKFLESCPSGLTHYLVGGSEECGQKFRERMMALNPSLNFVGSYHGKCSREGMLQNDEAVLEELREKRPDFMWVGLGAPKQYGWIHRVKPKLNHGVLLAVGFAFDVNAGMKPDAPAWMQSLGLTWLYRMANEPRRLVGRYLKWNSLFLWYSALDVLQTDRKSTAIRGEKFNKWKLLFRKYGLKMVDLFASEITDCISGKKLGRGLVIGWRGAPRVIGHPGLPPLIPRFLRQKRLTYWKQKIGFTTHPAPNYAKLNDAIFSEPALANPKVMNLLIAHEAGEKFDRVRQWWSGICPEENLWVAFGGTREQFESLNYPRKIFIDDPKLRKTDNQREKQCYAGIFRSMAEIVEVERADYIYLCEYDHLPLISDLNERQVDAMRQDGADVMGHWLYRVDGTGHYHELYHESDPAYFAFWRSLSRRENHSVILSMFGSGSFWTREAFLAVATRKQTLECYLELYLPTLAHHLGFRVRGWSEENHLISNLPSPSISMEEARKRDCWTVHPVKGLSKKAEKLKILTR